MKRDDFLSHIGDPTELRTKAKQIEAEALTLWQTIRDELFTKAGKPRPNPSWDARQTERKVNEMRGEEQKLIDRAHQIDRLRDDPWSHIRPDTLRREGLAEVADRVDAAYAEYIRAAEAA